MPPTRRTSFVSRNNNSYKQKRNLFVNIENQLHKEMKTLLDMLKEFEEQKKKLQSEEAVLLSMLGEDIKTAFELDNKIVNALSFFENMSEDNDENDEFLSTSPPVVEADKLDNKIANALTFFENMGENSDDDNYQDQDQEEDNAFCNVCNVRKPV
ncbi:14783_t:CDS:2 [Entrophospora sp. SA101]|nr:14783_t:CDS:2 [Entrophospora sp. SA101]